jgi:hypothetical protein
LIILSKKDNVSNLKSAITSRHYVSKNGSRQYQ